VGEKKEEGKNGGRRKRGRDRKEANWLLYCAT
jgi:hypothetical protein